MKVISFKTAILIVLLTLIIGCKQNAADESRSPGEIALNNYCRSCHAVPKPSMKTDEEWPALVARYGDRAKLSQEQINQITAYLTSNN